MQFKPQRLLKARKEAKLTRDDLAFELKKKKFDITSRTIFNLEKGKSSPNVDDMQFFCIVLNKPLAYFFV